MHNTKAHQKRSQTFYLPPRTIDSRARACGSKWNREQQTNRRSGRTQTLAHPARFSPRGIECSGT
eukprot:1119576-Pleurochrysis_carterae.AAC.2